MFMANNTTRQTNNSSSTPANNTNPSTATGGTLLDIYINSLLGNANPYTPMTAAEMEAEARRRVGGQFDQQRLNANQQHQAGTLARQQQVGSANQMYDEQVRQSNKAYADQQANTQRQALGTGMQRSSFTGQTLANIGIKGAQAEQAINRNRETTLNNIAAEQALADQQLAAQIAQLNLAQSDAELAYQDELEQREYERQMAAADRQNQIYADIFAAQQYATEHNLFGLGNRRTGSSGSSGSSGGRRGYTPPPGTGDDALSQLEAETNRPPFVNPIAANAATRQNRISRHPLTIPASGTRR